MSVKVISVLENILQANEQVAAENRARLDAVRRLRYQPDVFAGRR
jgi:hypothetical protein